MNKAMILYSMMYIGISLSTVLKSAVVVLNGTSCAGKSTVSKHILEKVGPYGSGICLDDIENSLKTRHEKDDVEKKARLVAYDQAHKEALAGKIVVLDAFIPEKEELEFLKKVRVIHVLIYAPFQALIERDQQRTQSFKRKKSAQEVAQGFVIESFCKLYQPCMIKEKSLQTLEARSFQSIFSDCLERNEEESYSYRGEQVQNFWHIFFNKGMHSSVNIMPRDSYDYVLDTSGGLEKTKEIASQIFTTLSEGKSSQEKKESKSKGNK